MSKPILFESTILDLVPFGKAGQGSNFFALRLSPPPWESWQPGQFVMVRPGKGWHGRLWARPFSLCRVTKRDLVLFFQVVGPATEHLARLNAGDSLDVWGPLGNAFAMESETPTLLLAGGIGIVPFVAYADVHPTPWVLSMEFGHKMPLDYYPFDSLNEKIEVGEHREYNLADRQKFLTLVDERIQEYAAKKGLILACGPTPFLQTVQRFSLAHKARTQLCVETKMACGIGACLGCVVKHLPSAEETVARNDAASCACETHVNVQTCTCGPNFWADQVVLE